MPIKDFMIANPKLSIIFAGFLITLVMTLITKFFTNQRRLKELKQKQKEGQAKMKELRSKGDMEAHNKIQGEIMQHSMEMMKHSLKPMLISFIPIILFFGWLRIIFLETSIASTWIWWYIGSAIISSIALRKVLDVA